MKINRYSGIYTLIFLLSFVSFKLFSQETELIVNPPSVFEGESANLFIQGSGTNFQQGQITINFIDLSDYIQVNNINIINPELVTVFITVDKNVPDEFLDSPFTFYIESIDEVFSGELTINSLGIDEPEAMITIFPIQSVFIADYDFTNLRNLPLLFTIAVYSPKEGNVDIIVELRHNEQYGMVASAYKTLSFNIPGTTLTFDNRQFDGFHKNKASDELIESATGSGIIPPGIYTYYVYLNGNEVTQSDFYIPESQTGIDMVGPGSPLEDDPETIFTNTPYFQWFGGFNNYKFTLYEVIEGQNSQDDINTNIPVFERNNLQKSALLYPASAESLVKGKKYAWQVSTEQLTSSGPKNIYSNMLWFIYQDIANINDQRLEKIIISPDDADVKTGDSLRIQVQGYNASGDLIPVNCNWELIPDDKGIIVNGNWFIAGKESGTCAVRIECEGIEDYIIINIIE